MKQETIEKRINVSIKKFIPNESEKVKEEIKKLIKITYEGLLEEHELDNNGKPYSDSRNLSFAISITLDDMDTPMILKEMRKDVE